MKCQSLSVTVAECLEKVTVRRHAFINDQMNVKLCLRVGEAGEQSDIRGLIALIDIVQAEDTMMHGLTPT